MSKLRTIFVALMLMTFVSTSAQTIEELRNRVKQDQEQLNATNDLLGKNQSEIRSSGRNRKLVENKITTRRRMVVNLERQASMISDEISATSRQVNELGQQLETLKNDYARFIYDSWKNHKMNNAVTFLFSSRDFNDATRRVSHMKRYNRMRETKALQIDSISYVLNYEIEKLNVRKQEFDRSKAEHSKEVGELSKEQKQLATILSRLQSDRKNLESQAREQKIRITKSQKLIDKIIAEQAKSARTKAQIEQDVILSGKFEDNKGKLPWPVNSRSVLHHFGKQKISPEITNDFKGIEIAAAQGAPVKAVFEGEVSGAYNLDRFNNCVTVRSGGYIILYGNLAKTNVKMGDKLVINQQLGTLSDGADSDQHMLIFQIWHEKTPLNPEEWLRK